MMFKSVDWATVFLPDTPVLEIIMRGTVVYIALFLMLRFLSKRQTGGIGISDVLVIVVIADAAQNAMAGSYNSIADGILLVATIMFWDHVIDWASYRFDWIGRIIKPATVPLIRNGRTLHKNMRSEMISMDELMAHLRENGLDTISQVKTACIESDGKISVVPRKGAK